MPLNIEVLYQYDIKQVINRIKFSKNKLIKENEELKSFQLEKLKNIPRQRDGSFEQQIIKNIKLIYLD